MAPPIGGDHLFRIAKGLDAAPPVTPWNAVGLAFLASSVGQDFLSWLACWLVAALLVVLLNLVRLAAFAGPVGLEERP